MSCHECDPSVGFTCFDCGAQRLIDEKAIATRTIEEMNQAKKEVIAFCLPHHELMWSSRIIGILLGCDFREAKDAGEKFLRSEQ